MSVVELENRGEVNFRRGIAPQSLIVYFLVLPPGGSTHHSYYIITTWPISLFSISNSCWWAFLYARPVGLHQQLRNEENRDGQGILMKRIRVLVQDVPADVLSAGVSKVQPLMLVRQALNIRRG